MVDMPPDFLPGVSERGDTMAAPNCSCAAVRSEPVLEAKLHASPGATTDAVSQDAGIQIG